MSSIRHISLIIPIYFYAPELYQPLDSCLKAVQEYYPDVELITVDDCSPLDLPEWPITSYNIKNKGFTVTVNRGLALATGDILIVMNDDITIQEGQLDRFLALDPTQLVIASPSDTSASPDDRFGACWGMTRATYALLGPLNEEYRHFFSDLDYYQRAKKAGVEIVKWRDIILEHPESSTYKLLDKEALLKADQARYNTK